MTTETEPKNRIAEQIEKSLAAEASSAHSRINVPLNLQNWKDLPAEIVEQLTWFHQHALNEGLSWNDLETALEYDHSTIFRVLKGTYEGSWTNVIKSIKSYRRLMASRASVQVAHFTKNPIYQRMAWALDYIFARGGCGLIIGEAGMGKTVCGKHWCHENNDGRSVFIECLPVGGAKGLLRQICEKVGANQNASLPSMLQMVARAFNKNRILVLDEAHQLLPGDMRGRPIVLDMVRRIHDLSGCALALIATERFEHDMKRTRYMFEQIIGRTGKPFTLPNEFSASDVLPLVKQFIPDPSDKFVETMVLFSNDRDGGRLRYVVDCLSFASKIANDQRKKLTEEIVLAAHAMRERQANGKRRAT